MQQEKIILKEDSKFFLVRRTICYETGFEQDLELVGSRYEIWDTRHRDKYDKDIIQEYTGGKMVYYCQLYMAENDQEMLKIFDKTVKS